MGLSCDDGKEPSVGAKQMLEVLAETERWFWDSLRCVIGNGQALHARDAAVSLALLKAFQASLGRQKSNDASVAVKLLGKSNSYYQDFCVNGMSLDDSVAITLRREFVEAIDQKFPASLTDGLAWLTITDEDSRKDSKASDEDEDKDEDSKLYLKNYWHSVRSRYCSNTVLDNSITPQVDTLPGNWMVISISITDDKSTMFLSRQRPHHNSLLFCVPLDRHGRREEDSEERLLFDDVMRQFKNILHENDISGKNAKEIPADAREAKMAWWARRVALDNQLRDLLDNIEFCWLGAFKACT
jgi:separase